MIVRFLFIFSHLHNCNSNSLSELSVAIKNKSVSFTGKSFSEALPIASINPQCNMTTDCPWNY